MQRAELTLALQEWHLERSCSAFTLQLPTIIGMHWSFNLTGSLSMISQLAVSWKHGLSNPYPIARASTDVCRVWCLVRRQTLTDRFTSIRALPVMETTSCRSTTPAYRFMMLIRVPCWKASRGNPYHNSQSSTPETTRPYDAIALTENSPVWWCRMPPSPGASTIRTAQASSSSRWTCSDPSWMSRLRSRLTMCHWSLRMLPIFRHSREAGADCWNLLWGCTDNHGLPF